MLLEEEKSDIQNTRANLSILKDEIKTPDLDTASVIVFTIVHRVLDSIVLRQTDIPEDKLIDQTADMVIEYLFT